MQRPPTLQEIQEEKRRRLASRCRGSLAAFIRESWHVLEPTAPLTWNWHIDAVADHLQAVFEDWMEVQRWLKRQADAEKKGEPFDEPQPEQRIQNLLINIPPGTAKSRIVSVCFPAWAWLHWPSFRALFLSANPRVALRDSMFCRDIIESKWYQETFQPDWELRDDQKAKGCYWNTAGGIRSAFGILARITGDRGDALIIDDPHDASEVKSDLLRIAVLEKWSTAIRNRVNDLRTCFRIGIMQRVHEDDWSGHVLKVDKFAHLCLPMEYEPQRLDAEKDGIPRVTPIGWSDPRTEPGELLFPQRFPQEVLNTEKTALGSAGYAGQHQQRPSPATGEIFQKHWWRFWQHPGQNLPPVKLTLPDGKIQEVRPIDLPRLEMELQSWDMSFKGTNASDYVCGQHWGRAGANRFLLDQVLERMGFSATCDAVKAFSAKHPGALTKLVEDKANGPAVIDSLHSQIPGLIAVDPEGGKEARAWAVSPLVESGNVYLPHPINAPWVWLLIDKCTAFPRVTNDDEVDALTQALLRWLRAGTGEIGVVKKSANRSSRYSF